MNDIPVSGNFSPRINGIPGNVPLAARNEDGEARKGMRTERIISGFWEDRMSQIAPPFSFLAILGRFPEAGIPAQLYIKSKEGAGTVVGLNMNIIRFIRCVFKLFFYFGILQILKIE